MPKFGLLVVSASNDVIEDNFLISNGRIYINISRAAYSRSFVILSSGLLKRGLEFLSFENELDSIVGGG
jgi:hypothetical protein